jgi:hypothetical protein|nr:MAG TPA: hypothetical protein [Caudoviricetes sp.]DAU60180.1 MAG TPA: hypothetical protein [Caudoviricetes sp.]
MFADAVKTDYKNDSDNHPNAGNGSSTPDVVNMDDPNAINTLLIMAGGKR